MPFGQSIASSRTPDNKVFLRWGAFFLGSVFSLTKPFFNGLVRIMPVVLMGKQKK